METLRQDLRFAVRLLRKEPGVGFLAVLTLALAIGANATLFSLVNTILLSPPRGIRNPGELVLLERSQKGFTGADFGYPDYLDYRRRSRTLSGLAAEGATRVAFEGPTTERALASLVSGNYFSVLGVRPALGRLLTNGDAGAPGESPRAVLSFDFWQSNFAADPHVVSKTVRLDRYPFTIVGVAASGFQGTLLGRPIDLWIPVTMQPQTIPRMSADILQDRAAGWLFLFGRLKPGVTRAQAQSDLQGIAEELAAEHPDTNATRRVAVLGGFGLDPEDRADLKRFFGPLMALVLLLLLLAASNVAGLELARSAARRREVAIRLALGSGRARLLRQLITESLLLWMMGGAAGLALAWLAAGHAMISPQPYFVTLRTLDFSPDAKVLGLTLAVTLFTGVLFGLAPGVEALRVNLVSDLREGSGKTGSKRLRTGQSTLVLIQVSLAFVLLAGAGMFARTLRNLLTVDRGFESKNLSLATLDLDNAGYAEVPGRDFYDRLLQRIRALPGVESACLTGSVPPTEWPGAVSVFLEGQAPSPATLKGREFELGLRVNVDVVSEGYFQTLRIPLVAGRDFNSQDRPDSPRVAIISRALAAKLWPGAIAVGKRLEAPNPDRLEASGPIEVVGVARDTLHRSLISEPPLLLYLPMKQRFDGHLTLAVKSPLDAQTVTQSIRSEVRALDPGVPVFGIESMAEHVDETLWQQKLAASLVGLFGVLAVALAAIGIYGVLSESVAQRTREMGVRMALGADACGVVRLVVGQGMRLVIVGVGMGLAAALVLGPLASALLFRVNPRDPATLAATAALLLAVGAGASFFPARRATRVEPSVALRAE
jgi:putative ABC transport system permease protein